MVCKSDGVSFKAQGSHQNSRLWFLKLNFLSNLFFLKDYFEENIYADLLCWLCWCFETIEKQMEILPISMNGLLITNSVFISRYKKEGRQAWFNLQWYWIKKSIQKLQTYDLNFVGIKFWEFRGYDLNSGNSIDFLVRQI